MISSQVTILKGVGDELAKKLGRLGINTVGDLLGYLPRKYNDYTHVTHINKIRPGAVTVQGTLVELAVSRKRRGLSVTEATLQDQTGSVSLVWFNQPWLEKQIHTGVNYYVSGELQFQYGRYAIQNPAIEPVASDTARTARVVPIYKETKGISSKQINKLVRLAFGYAEKLSPDLPEWIEKKQHYMSKADTIINLHYPESTEALKKAQNREAFTEIFALSLAGQINKQYDTSLTSPKITFSESEIVSFVKSLPFTLTDTQKKVTWKILQECQSSTSMNRLVEGDVGSGKTVVATIAAYNTVLAGFQVAFAAPTEILATQHHQELQKLLGDKVSIALLSGSQTVKEKKAIKEMLANGSTQIIIGTHALFQKDVQFKKLGLAIVDEQHRFGVDQRQSLLLQTKNIMPHMLTMTATPIPRSLALTLYGELSLSIMNELPPGRKPVKTKIVSPNSRIKMYEHVKEELKKGRQAFIVYPLISESDSLEAKSIEKDFLTIEQSFGRDSVAVLHGKMKPADKEAIMEKFALGKKKLLVGTTVIEVGVNIPNASIIVIEGAERFGLAQLHQLRGRVARASHQSYCYVVPSTSLKAPQRLREFEKSTDGFALAEYDLKERGPGAIYGKRQSGILELDLTTLNDKKLIETSQALAQEFIKRGENLLQYPRLERLVNTYVKVTKLN